MRVQEQIEFDLGEFVDRPQYRVIFWIPMSRGRGVQSYQHELWTITDAIGLSEVDSWARDTGKSQQFTVYVVVPSSGRDPALFRVQGTDPTSGEDVTFTL
ncbi:hypothetical protein E3O55_18960 [Cryobacterium sp. MDB1-18-2]|uniref:hypothetical protein n=1 Tax=unclassified Cryobacterium TaxID=2649013 RepID=UPI0010690039|nr:MULTISPECIES: hypothetical protein [unclassified Cryobacterium]TFC22099.1 hypothetical protein E3O55_18960 [Cryobacterium sp. MDB1-18-2]TFC40672.1 hypothetical protein E3O50_12755 [Cryobacterium sp. MDB1-18-1]